MPTRRISRDFWTTRRAVQLLLAALANALGAGVALHRLHAGLHEAEPIGPVAHWLRDSLLAWPASATALLVATLLTLWLADWASIPARSRTAVAIWTLLAAGGFALLSIPGNAVHGGVFGAQHEGMSFVAHAVRDGGVTMLASLATLALPAAAGAGAARLLRRRGSRSLPVRVVTIAALAATVAFGVVLAGPKGFEQGISNALTPGICPSGSRTVVYDVAAFQTVIPLNGWGDKLPDGLVYALKNADARTGKADILKNPNLTQPLTVRANVGDCIKVRLRNDIAGRRIGIHAGGGLVRYDPEDSDGARVGKNPNTTLAPDGAREFTWYADHTGQTALTDVVNIDGDDPKVPTVSRGLYGALIVHPKGTTWHDPSTGENLLAADADGSFHAVETDVFADVRDPGGNDFRSFAIVMMDEAEGVVDPDGKVPTFPTTGLEDSTFGINYRSEPLRNRMRAILEHRGTVTPENPNGRRRAVVLPTGRVIDPNDHFCDGYVPELDRVVEDPGAKCMGEESHLQSWVFGDEGKLTHTLDEHQKVAVTGASGGTFTLSFRGQVTAPIPHDAGPAAVQAALETLPALRPGDVEASAADAAAGAGANTGGVRVQFKYHYAGDNVPEMLADGAALTAADAATPAAAAVATIRNGRGIVVDTDNAIPKAYKSDRIRFHVIHPGSKETHPWHQHTQRWFADPGNAKGVDGANTSPRNDVQSIGPGDSRELVIEGGAGGEQKTIGDSIFHCHLYPHFAQGFWGHLRIYDRLRDGTQKLPDGSPLQRLQTLPDQDGGTPAPDAAHPGFPLFVKGDVGQRAYRPPNTVIKDRFASLRRPGDAPRGPTEAEAANLPGLGAAAVSADGTGNGVPNPGAGYIDPCPSSANVRVYRPHAVDTPITYNSSGWKDPEGRVYVEGEEGVQAVRAGKNPEPYTIRARLGECVQLQTTNDLHLDDDPDKPVDRVNDKDGTYSSTEETSEVSTHVHLVQFDELGSDGTSVGWNYTQSAMPGQTYGYRWYVDQPLRTVFFHDHQYANLHQRKGLFAAMNVEPADAEWRDPKTGDPTNGVGPVADIVSSSGKDFREMTVFYQDRAPMWRADAAGTAGAGAAVEPPAHVDDYASDQGGVAINYRNEPFQTRTKASATGPKGDPAYTFSSVVHGDPSTPVFKAYEKDPVVVRNVAGSHEEMHTFNLHGHRWLNEPDNPTSALTDTQSMSLAEYFNYDLQGTTLFRRKATAAQTLQTAQSIGDGAPQLLEAGAGKPGDYLYGSTFLDMQWLGAWGIFRVPKEVVPDLKPLPDQVAAGAVPRDIPGDDEWGAQAPGDTAPLPNPTNGRAACPVEAPQRNYQITALRTKITYNEKFGDHDPNGLIYAPTSDVAFDANGVGSLKTGVKPKPLYLRANAGDCVRVALRNGLPLGGLPPHTGDVPVPADVSDFPSSNRVSIHAGMVKTDVYMSDGTTVGYNWDQTVKPGETKIGFWWADEALAGTTIPLSDYGDRRGHPHHGLWGGLLVEPKGATWTDPKTGASLEGVKDATSGLITGTKTAEAANIKWTKPDGTVDGFREFVAGWQDGLNLRQGDGTAVPVAGAVDDPYEMGNRGINYRTERFAPRLAYNAAQSNVFSSAVHGDPATPVFRAYVGEPVKLRVLQGQDRGRAHTFLLDGHEWPSQHTDPSSMPRSSQDGLMPGRAFTFNLIGGAGGRQGATGDYLFRDGLLSNQVNAGLWGLLRVHGTLQPDLPPLK